LREDLGVKNKMVVDKDQELADIEIQIAKEWDKREKVSSILGFFLMEIGC
jgi:hypothetical protein